MNGSLNAKEEFTAVVNQGEKFEVALGVDDAVWVKQKPVGEYLQHTGFINKSSISAQEQRLMVKNTKVGEEVRLTIHERVPKSTDDEIKVKLHEPPLSTTHPHANCSNGGSGLEIIEPPEPGALLDGSNNLQWTVALKPKEEREMVIKWTVEYPSSKKIEYH